MLQGGHHRTPIGIILLWCHWVIEYK